MISAFGQLLGWMLIVGAVLRLDFSMPAGALAICVVLAGAGAAIIVWARRPDAKEAVFTPRDVELEFRRAPAWAMVPRAPKWAAAIEMGVGAFRQSHFSEAASHFKSANSNYPPLNRFISVNNLAAAYCAERRYAEAEPLYRHLVDTWYVSQLPDVGPAIFLGLNNLATTLVGQGRYDEGEAALRQALETVLPTEWEMQPYPDLAETLENLALLHVAKARVDLTRTPEQSSLRESGLSTEGRSPSLGEARLWAEWALAICEAALGDQHADLVSTLMTLEEVCRAQNQQLDAERFRDRARLLCERARVLDDFDALGNLPRCGLWDSLGRWLEPRSLSERWLLRKFSASNANELLGKISASNAKELEIAYALDQFATSCVASALARWVHCAAVDVQANALRMQALRIRERVLGEGHPEVLENCEQLAGIVFDPQAGKEFSADTRTDAYQKALDAKVRRDGPNDPSLISTLVRLSDDAMSSNWDHSADLLTRANAIAEQAYGGNDPRLVPLLTKLANIRHDWQGQHEAAEHLYSQALGILDQAAGADHWKVASILPALGDIYVKLKRPAEAGECYRRLITLEARVFGPENFRVREHLETLAQIDPRSHLSLLHL